MTKTTTDRGGYTKAYKDKERLFEFLIWLERTELRRSKKNMKTLKLISDLVKEKLDDGK